MTKSFKLACALGGVCALGSMRWVEAQEMDKSESDSILDNQNSMDSQDTSSTITDPDYNFHWSFNFGQGVGLMVTQPTDSNVESSKSGWFLEPSLGLRFQQKKWSAGLSLGWHFSYLSGDPAIYVHPTYGPDREYVSSRLGILGLQAHYRFNDFHRLGPILELFWGADSSFSPWVLEDQSPNMLLGVHYQYERHFFEQVFWYAGASLLTDLTIVGRTIWQLGGQIGLQIPFGASDSQSNSRQGGSSSSSGEPAPVREKTIVKTVVKYKVKVRDRFVYALDSEFVVFKFNSTDLEPRSRDFLVDIAQALKENNDIWESLSIEGHTDTQGDPKYNQMLSEKRAKVVYDVFVSSGVDASKLKYKGFGSARPLSKENTLAAHARNRRVEIHFSGVKDFSRMNETLNRVKLKYR